MRTRWQANERDPLAHAREKIEKVNRAVRQKADASAKGIPSHWDDSIEYWSRQARQGNAKPRKVTRYENAQIAADAAVYGWARAVHDISLGDPERDGALRPWRHLGGVAVVSLDAEIESEDEDGPTSLHEVVASPALDPLAILVAQEDEDEHDDHLRQLREAEDHLDRLAVDPELRARTVLTPFEQAVADARFGFMLDAVGGRECESCGVRIDVAQMFDTERGVLVWPVPKPAHRPRVFCDECAEDARKRATRERVAKHRAAHVTPNSERLPIEVGGPMSQTIPDRIDDHEQRITDLEYALWRIGSAAVAVEPPAEKKPPAVLRLVENDELTQEGR